MEKEILAAVRIAMDKAITETLCGHSGPLRKLTEEVVDNHRHELFELIDDAVKKLIGGKEFKKVLQSELNQKLAKTLISKMGGEFEKRVNELRASPATRAKITLALTELIESL